MIKIQSNTATREPIPQFLVGLAATDLADLSWTDPQLGVSDCAWWPEEDQSPAPGEFERYGDETLGIDAERQVVVVTRAVVPWTAEEIAAYRKSLVPESVTMRQARQAMLSAGILSQVDALIAAMPGDDGESARIDWGHAHDVKRDWPLIGALGPQLGLTEQGIDDLFIYAATIPQ